MKPFIFICLSSLLFISCEHTRDGGGKTRLTAAEEINLYKLISEEVLLEEARDLSECNCMEAFYRDFSKKPDNTARYVLDRAVGKHGVLTTQGRNTVNILSIGPGTLLSELTAFSYLLALGKDLNLYLNEWAYIFYEEKNFKEKAIQMAENPDLIPEGWKRFYFWRFHKEKDPLEPYIPFFERHHKALDEFKIVLNKIAKHYGRKVTISLIEPPKEKALLLPKTDLILTVDSFFALPNIMWELYYTMPLEGRTARFITLNKDKPLGGFWDADNINDRHLYTGESVGVEVYDVSGSQKEGNYKLVERQEFQPTPSQTKNSINFKENPRTDTRQGVFDFIKPE